MQHELMENGKFIKIQMGMQGSDKGKGECKWRSGQTIHVNDVGELVIPEYLEAEINDEERARIKNWPMEMDFKMLHYLKNMEQTHISRNKWQWLARTL